MAELDGNSSEIAILGVETLTDGAFTDGTDWDGTGDFTEPPAGTAEFTKATGAGDMTQTNANLASTPENSKRYRLVQTIAVTTPLAASTALTITSAFALVAKVLDATVGTKYEYFISAVAANVADFVYDVTAASAGVFTIDNASLRTSTVVDYVSADYNDERQISEVPPDTATAGKDSVDPNLYQATLSITGNTNVAAGAWFGSGAYLIETAYNAGGSSNVLALDIKPDSTDDNYRDAGNFRVYSFKKGLKVGEIQQWSAELKSTGDITRTRPTA